MDKLSELIKEARPLYKQRKRNQSIAKAILTLTMPVMIFTGAWGICQEGDNIYVALEEQSFQEEFLNNDLGIMW